MAHHKNRKHHWWLTNYYPMEVNMFDAETIETAVQIITAVISAASIIAAATPPGRDDAYVSQAKGYWRQARRVINVLGFNVRNARNLEDE